MADWYILVDADGHAISHRSANSLPYDKNKKPQFVTSPRDGKRWFKEATYVEAPVGAGQRKTGPFYENLDKPIATIRYGVEAIPAAVVPAALQDTTATTPQELQAAINEIKAYLRGE